MGEVDPEVAEALEQETERQETNLVLIPSENYASRAVRTATGSIFANKYAEGYGRARYYNGCRWSIRVEDLAIERAKALFGAEHANVQVHSGSQANMAAYYALLEPGDTVLAMDLAHGGHLTHGEKINFSGRTYRFVAYGVSRETETIDYDRVSELAREHHPRMIVAGASAYPRTIDFARFRGVADEVGAYLLADVSHIAGLIAGGCHPSPVPYADIVTSTTHKTLRGPRGAIVLCRAAHAKKIDKAVFPGVQSGPFMNVIAAKAVALREASSEAFRDYARRVVENARVLAEGLASLGLRLVSGGTDNHLMLVDLTSIGVTGRDAADALEESGIVVNKNTIPFETKGPQVASGIRPGTPAVTSRGMGTEEMKRIAAWMGNVLSAPGSPEVRMRVREEVAALCREFPVCRQGSPV
ncbi:MAG: serine hydroxymethyltransferase [Planctomycetes bacterium]|nr:serine hydroxymethyltransferase [Planctomycetota bacterium]